MLFYLVMLEVIFMIKIEFKKKNKNKFKKFEITFKVFFFINFRMQIFNYKRILLN